MIETLKLGTRGSLLARTQSQWVADRLSAATGLPVELVIIQTRGDRVQDRPLAAIGGKGLFTEELEAALRDGHIDLAVHSLKDLPTEMPEDLLVGAIPRRADPSDVLVGSTLASLARCSRAQRSARAPRRWRCNLSSARIAAVPASLASIASRAAASSASDADSAADSADADARCAATSCADSRASACAAAAAFAAEPSLACAWLMASSAVRVASSARSSRSAEEARSSPRRSARCWRCCSAPCRTSSAHRASPRPLPLTRLDHSSSQFWNAKFPHFVASKWQRIF